MKRVMFAGLMAVGLTLAAGTTARAEGTFSMFTVNNTTDVTLSYQVRWDGGRWQDFTVPPRTARNHWCEEINGGHSAEIRFDRGDRTGDLRYSLVLYSGTDTSQGTSYTLQYHGRYLDLTRDN